MKETKQVKSDSKIEQHVFVVKFKSDAEESKASERIEWLGPVHYRRDRTAVINKEQLKEVERLKIGFENLTPIVRK